MKFSRTPAVSRLIRRSGCGAFIVTLLACETPPRRERQSLPTQLERPLAEYLTSPNELVGVADRGGWDAGERARRPACTSWPCERADAVADMQIDAAQGLREYGPPAPAGLHGAVIARLRNHGRVGIDSVFGARPGATVYAIAQEWESGEPARAQTRFVEVWSESGELRAREIGNGLYRACPEHPDPLPSPARFGGCTPAGMPHRIPATGEPTGSDILRVPGPGDGQIGCPWGCCELDVREFFTR